MTKAKLVELVHAKMQLSKKDSAHIRYWINRGDHETCKTGTEKLSAAITT